jgi:transposase
MAKQNDLSRSLIAFEQNNTLIAVIEMSLNSWLVAGIVPAVERPPLKKMSVDGEALLQLLYRWRTRRPRLGVRSLEWRSPLRLVATVSGWRGG